MDKLPPMDKLHQALRDGDTALAHALTTSHPQLVSAADDAGWTALHIASSLGNLQAVRQLLHPFPTTTTSSSSPINLQTKGGQTALHYAASRGHLAVVQWLLEQPGVALLQDNQGWTAIHRAAALGHHAILTALAARFPKDLDVQDVEGNGALHVACQELQASCIKALREAGARLDRQNNHHNTPIDCIDVNNGELRRVLQQQQ